MWFYAIYLSLFVAYLSLRVMSLLPNLLNLSSGLYCQQSYPIVASY